jgi:hypothetical protein
VFDGAAPSLAAALAQAGEERCMWELAGCSSSNGVKLCHPNICIPGSNYIHIGNNRQPTPTCLGLKGFVVVAVLEIIGNCSRSTLRIKNVEESKKSRNTPDIQLQSCL